MKFKSRKDILFTSIILGICAFLFVITVIGILKGEMQTSELWSLPLIGGSIVFLLWILFGTNYEIDDTFFIYRCGPFNGKVNANRIREIVKGKTSWIGFRPATARNGLIIKYDQYNEIYISPSSNDQFIKQILELNKNILISD